MRNKNQLLGSVGFGSGLGINPLLRGPKVVYGPNDGEGGGSSGGDNSQGNSGSGENSGQTQDYGSAGADLTSFWNPPKDDAPAAATASQGNPNPQGNGQQQQANQPTAASQFMERMNGVKFDDPFTEKVIAELGEGKLEGVNGAFQSMAKKALTESVTLSAHLMQQFGQELMAQVKAEIQNTVGGNLQSRDDDKLIMDNFPSAKDPRVKPAIEQAFKQSLLHSKGDRTKAVEMTKNYLKIFGNAAGDDLGRPPANPDDSGEKHPGVTSLLEGLMGRG